MSIQTNKLPDNPQIEVIKSGKTGLFTNYIYKAIPLAFDESMSYYETLCGLLNYLQNTIIPTVNNNADAVAELQSLYEQLRSYVDNYFTNLDVQEEINNKLDQMVTDGTLASVIEPLVTTHLTSSVNVKSLGAKGDGKTNDTEIIQNAINEYDVVYIPAGNYIIDTLNIPSNKIINGDGLSNTILTFTNLQNGIKMQGITSAISQIEFNNVSFRSSFSENIIYINNGYGIVFNNCEIYDTSNLKQSNGLVIDGADINPPTDGAGYYVSFINGRIVVCKIGVKMINQANSNLISNVEMYANKQCIYLDNSNGNKIICNTLQDFLTNAIEIDNTNDLSYSTVNIIIGNYIEALINNEIETGIKLNNDKVKCTQLISNKFNNLHNQNVNEIIDNGSFTLRLDYQNTSPGQEPITLPTFVRINPRGTNFANAYKNEKLFGCVQMFADDEQSGKVMAENRIYNSETGQYSYYWSELLGFNNNNKYDLTNKTIENGSLLNTNILLYGNTYIKLANGNLPETAGAMMYDDGFKRPKFYDGTTTRHLQYNAIGPSSSRSNYQGYGFCMFDTTLNKPIWYNGNNWVDATGTTV